MGWGELARCVAGARDSFQAEAHDARRTQEALLRSILQANADCAFGRQHGFGRIADLAAYARAVPATDGEGLRGEVDAIAGGQGNRLFSAPVVAFERTGGSSGGAKLVPFTQAGLANLRRGLFAWLDDLATQRPGVQAGSSYWSISPATRACARTDGGIRIGMASDAEYFGEAAHAIAALLAVPPAVGAIAGVGDWRRQTLLHLLADDSLALVSVWSPTFLLELLRHAVLDHAWLAQALAARSPARAALADQVLAAPQPDWRVLWPRLALVSCWTHASAAPWSEDLRRTLAGVEIQGKGLLATEGLVSIPWCDGGDPVAAVGSTVLEFEDDRGHAWPCDALETGAEYTVLLTTAAGLYRYRLGDRVRVTGWMGEAPRLLLLGRTRSDSDLCGEKLTEAFVLQCWRDLGLGAGRLVAAAHPRPRYELWLPADARDADRTAHALDTALHANPQYAHARRLGQLDALVARRVEQLAARMQQAAVARGQRLGDAKPSVLAPAGEALP